MDFAAMQDGSDANGLNLDYIDPKTDTVTNFKDNGLSSRI